MEFTINKDEFLRGLQKSQSIAEKRSSMPILSNVLLRTEGQGVSLTATDLEVSFTGHYQAMVAREGALTVQARKIYEIVKEMPGDEVHLTERENKWLRVVSGKSEFNLVGLPADEFPPVTQVDEITWVSMEAALLHAMIDKTLYAVSTEETRYNLAGIYFEKVEDCDPPELKLVATDGHRLSLVSRPLAAVKMFPFEHGVIIPRKGMYELSRLLEENERVEVGFYEQTVVFKFDQAMLTTRLIDGDFPQYNTVIPKKARRILRFNRNSFMDVLRRMSIISSDRYRGVRCRIQADSLEVISNNPELGDAREEMAVEYEGEEMTIAFNPKYFLDALAVMESETVEARMIDEASACTLAGEKDEGFMAVIMPMRL